MKKIMLLALAGALSGCSALNTAVNTYGSVALSNAREANDTAIAMWSTAACATPLSAILRNPQIVPALRVLCLPTDEQAVPILPRK